MIICPNCGTKQIEGTLFCNDCGADLTGLEEGIDPNLDLSRESKYTTANIPPSNFSIPVIPQGTFPVAPPAPVSGSGAQGFKACGIKYRETDGMPRPF